MTQTTVTSKIYILTRILGERTRASVFSPKVAVSGSAIYSPKSKNRISPKAKRIRKPWLYESKACQVCVH